MTRARPVRRIAGSVAAAALLMGATSGTYAPDAPVADAARAGDLETVRTLIAAGEDVNAPHGDGMTALHWAADAADREMTALLVYAGANLEAGTRIGTYVPLHLASRSADATVVTTLLEAGANPNASTTTTGVQPIHLASESGDAEVIRTLVRHGADVDAREASWGHTPLIFAASRNRSEAVRALLELGADPEIRALVVDVDRRAAVDALAQERLEEVLAQFRSQEAEASEDWTPSPEQVRAAVRASRRVQEEGVLPEEGDSKVGPGR